MSIIKGCAAIGRIAIIQKLKSWLPEQRPGFLFPMFLWPIVPIVPIVGVIVSVSVGIIIAVERIPIVIIARIPTVMIARVIMPEVWRQPIMSWHLIMMVSIVMWLGNRQCAK
jgi:hypothetical protein